jgi:hypothetical protein
VFFALGCKKENGRIFLKVVPPSDITYKEFVVTDAKRNIPVDGNYHEVFERLEYSYKFENVLTREIIDWTPEILIDKYDSSSYGGQKYLGEFEKFEFDTYYTLKIKFDLETEKYYVKPLNTIWGILGDYYYYSYMYADKSEISNPSKNK